MTKIIVSLTTIKNRLNMFKKTITSLINQTYTPDTIHIFYSNEPFLFDDGINDDDITQLYNDIQLINLNNINIIFTKTQNIGPYRKLIPALQLYTDDIIIVVDDDIYYNNNFIYTYVNAYNKYKCIICSQYRTFDFSNGTWLTNYYLNTEMKCMNIIPEGYGGILYHSNMFNIDFINFDYSKLDNISIKNDDIFFRLYTYYNNIYVVVVNIKLNQINTNDLPTLYYNYNIYADFEHRIQLMKQYDVINKYLIISDTSVVTDIPINAIICTIFPDK